jgi:hypothetical protein
MSIGVGDQGSELAYRRAFVYEIRISTAAPRSELSSTSGSVRICSRLCRTVSSSLITAGYNRASTAFALPVFDLEGCEEDTRAVARSRSRSTRRDSSWYTMYECTNCRSRVPEAAVEPDVCNAFSTLVIRVNKFFDLLRLR